MNKLREEVNNKMCSRPQTHPKSILDTYLNCI